MEEDLKDLYSSQLGGTKLITEGYFGEKERGQGGEERRRKETGRRCEEGNCRKEGKPGRQQE